MIQPPTSRLDIATLGVLQVWGTQPNANILTGVRFHLSVYTPSNGTIMNVKVGKAGGPPRTGVDDVCWITRKWLSSRALK
jgi:hypothetical protein